MGWSSGSGLMDRVIKLLKDDMGDPDKRFYFYMGLIDTFLDYDCDTLDECLGTDEEFDRAYRQTFGEEDE